MAPEMDPMVRVADVVVAAKEVVVKVAADVVVPVVAMVPVVKALVAMVLPAVVKVLDQMAPAETCPISPTHRKEAPVAANHFTPSPHLPISVSPCLRVSLSPRKAMSLLELVLAMSLSVVLMGLIGNAIYFHLRAFQTRQDGVEQSLLARAILRQIGDDLRSAVANRKLDMKGIDAVAQDSQQLAGLAASAGVDPTSIANATRGSSNTAAAPQGANPAANQANAEEQAPAEAGESYEAGFYGDPFSVQFDMTRLPRLDEYDPLFAANGSGDVLRIPADMRTISYHLQGEASVERTTTTTGVKPDLATKLATHTTLEPRGLVRSEQERSLAAAGVVVDSSDEANNSEQLLAEEVTRLEFRYFDGYEWWPEWDSSSRGGLPLAVEIIIGLANANNSIVSRETIAIAQPPTAGSGTTTANANETLYRLVVNIPTAEPLPMQEEQPTEGEPNTNSDSAKQSTQGDMP